MLFLAETAIVVSVKDLSQHAALSTCIEYINIRIAGNITVKLG